VLVEKADNVRELFEFGDLAGSLVALRAANIEQVIVGIDEQRLEAVQLIVHHHLQNVIVDQLTHLRTVGHLSRMRSPAIQ